MSRQGDIVLHEINGQFALGIMYLTPTHFVSSKRPKGWALIKKDGALKALENLMPGDNHRSSRNVSSSLEAYLPALP